MSFNSPKLDFTLEASADLSANQFEPVDVVAGGAAVAAADGPTIVGVLQNNPDAVGQAAVIQNKGVAQAKVGEAVSRGDRLFPGGAGNGFILTGTAGNDVATALEDGSGAGSVIAVLLD